MRKRRVSAVVAFTEQETPPWNVALGRAREEVEFWRHYVALQERALHGVPERALMALALAEARLDRLLEKEGLRASAQGRFH